MQARPLFLLLGRIQVTPLPECSALTFARELQHKLKISYRIEYGVTNDKFSEQVYIPDIPRISTPTVFLTPSSPKIIIAHELIHIQRKHNLSRYRFTASLIPPAYAIIEHSGGNVMIMLLPMISTLVLNKLFCQYCELEADLMASDLVSEEEIKEGIENLKEVNQIKEEMGYNYFLIDTHPPIETRIDFLSKQLDRRNSSRSRLVES